MLLLYIENVAYQKYGDIQERQHPLPCKYNNGDKHMASTTRRTALAAALAITALAATGHTMAQDGSNWPIKPIKLTVPYTPAVLPTSSAAPCLKLSANAWASPW